MFTSSLPVILGFSILGGAKHNIAWVVLAEYRCQKLLILLQDQNWVLMHHRLYPSREFSLEQPMYRSFALGAIPASCATYETKGFPFCSGTIDRKRSKKASRQYSRIGIPTNGSRHLEVEVRTTSNTQVSLKAASDRPDGKIHQASRVRQGKLGFHQAQTESAPEKDDETHR
ncbi:unnamed protein product [Fusarium fujikuroi]|nr:unnamed protein product [Fusarium fujikuroi]